MRTVHLTIPNVVKEYERLIAQKRFPGEDAIAKIPEYERGQLARTVYNGFYNAPDDVPRPYPKGADYYDALPMIEEQLQDKGKTAEMLAALTSRLDGTDESDRFYDSVRRAKDRLSEYVDGTFSLFNHRHDAPQQERSFVEQVAEDAARLAAEQPPAYERFSVIETEDGYAVWDDIRDEIYVDNEGVRETFPSEWKAEDYLEQVRKAVSEKEAAEWLYVEQSRNTAVKPEQPQSEPVSTADPVIVGTRLTIDGRQFEVDSVDDLTQKVSLRDVTFEGGTGFPIFRKESIEYVRSHMEQSDIAQETAAPQTDEPPAALTPPKKKKQNALAYVYDADGRKTAVLNKKETAIAQSKQELIKDAFAEWIWKDPDRREAICKTYNILFNSNRPREYDGSHISFSGMNPEITLRKHQVNAIAHILYGGNTLLAHVVGAGKTFEMVAAAMESKRLGLCQKSLFVVPNHLTEQWATEFLQLYPAANILVATRKDFETKNRKKFCGRIATGDYDAVIIGHSQFEKIPMSVERQRAILEQQIDEIMMGISEAKREKAENFTIKQMEKTKKGLQAKIDKLNDQSRKDDVVTFEELGVDRIFIDESHYFKNLFLWSIVK